MRKLATLFILIFVSTSVFAQVSEAEKQALLDLYVQTDGDNWNTTWDVNTPVKSWHGVVVDNNHVVSLNLMFNNLKGKLPSSIGQLENLETLELSFNQLTGTIPVSIGEIKSLKNLAINSNQLQGSIPSSLGNLVNLFQLHLSSNELIGTIPVALGELKYLEVLNVFDNGLTGTLPFGLSESKSLKSLVVAENDLIITDTFADIRLFKVDNNKTRFITPNAFKNKTVLAIETSDDNN